MLETVLFHLGGARDLAYVNLALRENRNFLAAQAFHYPEPYYAFAGLLHDLLKRFPEISPKNLPLTKPFIKEFRSHLKNAAEQANPRIFHILFGQYFGVRQALPILHALVQSVFPQVRIKAFFSLARQDINLMAMCRNQAIFGRDARVEKEWLTYWLQHSANFAYDPALREIFDLFGRENVECFVSNPPSDAPEDMRHTALLAQEAFWRFAGVSVPPDPETGLACFRPRLELCLPPEFHAFCRCCNTLQPEPYPLFTSPWAEQSMHFTDQGSFFSSFSPAERAVFVAAHGESNARVAALLGRNRLFTPVDPEQAYEPFPGLTIETAFKVAERLDRDFAAILLAKFAAVPVLSMSHMQRLCRQALHDALAPPSAMPLPHRGRTPKVSVLTLTYNHGPYITECIEGVLAQETHVPIQHIIADDCSNDGAQDIILDYAAKYPHIVPVFQKKRSGGPENLRALFDAARTEYVALCDGDDYFTDPTKLQTQVDLLDANRDAALCFHKVRVLYEDDAQSERLYPPEEVLPRGIRPFYYLVDLIRNNFIQSNSVMYRWRFRDALPDWFRVDLMPGDRYWHLLHAEMGKIAFVNEVMSVYRRHEKSVYYLSETDALKHRAKVGMREIEVLNVINKHFNRQYESIILDLINHIFADCLLYDNRQEEEGVVEKPMLHKLSDKYPDFARHFLYSLDKLGKAES